MRARRIASLDEIWISAARNLSLRVVRSRDVYAHSDGNHTLYVGEEETLDADDSLAQLIFHELCHAMVEGPDSLELPDWGLDNTSKRHLVHEHACLRLQAELSRRVGLRAFFAPTTVFRRYYDSLPADPLQPADDTAVQMALAGLKNCARPPFHPHVQQALAATARLQPRRPS